MANQTNKQVIERIFGEGMNNRNYAVFQELLAPDYVNYTFRGSQPGPVGFTEEVKKFVVGFPDLKLNHESIVVEGDNVATRGYWTGTHKGEFLGMPPTNKTVRVEFMDFWKFKNGKPVENWVQMDFPGLMAQLGTAPVGAR
jgi:predicted ester cyclase